VPRKLPSRVGRFEVRELLGRGGMGEVYLADQPELDRPVVLKALRRGDADDPASLVRFRREAQAAAMIQHQNVVAVHDFFTWRQEDYIVQEYVEGEDLGSILRREGALPWTAAALIALGLLRGLEEIHAREIVHRDLKPANVLVGRDGEVKVADFGIVFDSTAPALTRTGMAMGSPPYMSPEQMLGETVDARSDLYSFGVILYEMLCGKVPFAAHDPENGVALLQRMKKGQYDAIDDAASGVPRWLRKMAVACLHYKARKRPSQVVDLRREIERRLGSPSPADARADLADLLFDPLPEVVEAPETVILEEVLSAEPKEGPGWLPSRRSVSAVIVFLLLVGGGLGYLYRDDLRLGFNHLAARIGIQTQERVREVLPTYYDSSAR